MRLTVADLATIAGTKQNANMASTIAGLERAGVGAGLNRPHRLAMFLGQLAHESMGWHYDREVWGPTAAQRRYDTRTDLGNTPAADGDGYLYRGRGPIQLTGRSNYAAFTAWARRMDPDAPDFVAKPDLVNTDPWEGLVAIWYWDSRGINRHADAGDFRAVTKAINGGYNGLEDRERRYTRAGLALLGYRPTDVAGFQRDERIGIDGIAGTATRGRLFARLKAVPLVSFGEKPAPPASKPIVMPKPPAGTRPVEPRPRQAAHSPAAIAILIAAVAVALFFYMRG